MRKTISKKLRQEVYKKYGGLCAYCGCTLPEKGFHIDHKHCVRNYDGKEDVNDISNLMPSCRSCNKYKSTFELEEFRKMISGIPGRLRRDSSTYNIALRYGLVEEHEKEIVFWHEKWEEENREDKTSTPDDYTAQTVEIYLSKEEFEKLKQ